MSDRASVYIRECTGPRVGTVHPLPAGIHVIGRASQASVVLDDVDVSRRHAALEVSAAGVTVRDLDSKNGVIINNEVVREPILLGHGERFTVGNIELEVHHPSTQVLRALERAGELTATSALDPDTPADTPRPSARASLLLPVAATLLFAALSVWLWLRDAG
ncbi:MAG: FHA domain-containing protein [Nannocystaceae bacterium]